MPELDRRARSLQRPADRSALFDGAARFDPALECADVPDIGKAHVHQRLSGQGRLAAGTTDQNDLGVVLSGNLAQRCPMVPLAAMSAESRTSTKTAEPSACLAIASCAEIFGTTAFASSR